MFTSPRAGMRNKSGDSPTLVEVVWGPERQALVVDGLF